MGIDLPRVPFDPSELEVQGQFPPCPPIHNGAPILNTPITPRENFMALRDGKKPLWVPMNTDEAIYHPGFLADNAARRAGGKDYFGVEWVYVPQVGGSMVRPGKPFMEDANDWEKLLKFPNIRDYDWDAANRPGKDQYVPEETRAASGTILNGYFERLISLMDFQYAAMAMVDEDQKDAVKDLFWALTDFYKTIVDCFVEYYHIDFLTFHDDWGSQRAPFFSLDTIEEMLVPPIGELVDYAKSKGLYVEMHSCGKNDMVVPAYIDAGVDTWTGQPMCDKPKLYEMYGDKLTLGVSPEVVPEDAPLEAVYAEAERFCDQYVGLDKPPVIASFRGNHPKMREVLYEVSRKRLNP